MAALLLQAAVLPENSLKQLFLPFRPRGKKPTPTDPLEITSGPERRRVFLGYVNRGWLVFGIVTLITLPLFPEQRSVFGYLVAVTLPTYLVTRWLNRADKPWLAGVVFTLSVNFCFYGLFMVLVAERGAADAFETESTVWMLMGLAVLFAGAFVDKWAAPGLALVNSLLLIGTRLTLAPAAQPRPAPIVFWWMMALTIWFYERTLGEALSRSQAALLERKRAEEALGASAEQYRALFETAPVGIGVADRTGKLLAFNNAMLLPGGYTHEEIQQIGTVQGLYYDTNQRTSVLALFEKQGFLKQYPIQFARKDGTPYDTLLTLTPIQFKGQPCVQALVEDVTARRQAEQALRQSEINYRSLAENSLQAITIFQDQKIVYVNPATCRIYGYTFEEMTSMSAGQIVALTHQEDRTMVEERIRKRSAGELLSSSVELRIVRKDGSTGWIQSFNNAIEYNGRPAILSTNMDITERKQAEDNLRKTEARYRTLAEQIPPIVYVASPHQHIGVTYISPQIKTLGFTEEEWLADPELWFRQIHPEDQARVREEIRQITENGLPYKSEYRLRTRDGDVRWLLDEVRDIVDNDGNILFRQGFMLDISDRKRAEEEIRRRLGEFEVLYETSNSISVEHDLNTLLRAIVENARTLLHSASSGMYLALPGSEELELTVDTEPYIPSGSRLQFGEGMAGRVAQTRRPLRVDDYSTWEGRSPAYEGTSLRAVLEVPMLYKGELIGVLTADEVDESMRRFTEADEHLLSLFASQAAGAIHSARLREQTVQRLSELEVLYQSGLALSRLVDPKAIAQKIIDLLDQKMDWHHTAIRLYDPENETLELLAFNQPGLDTEDQRQAVEERFKTMVARAGQGLSGWVVQHGVTVRSRDLKNDPRYADTFPGLRSGLYVPIKIAERVIGVISIESEQADAFTESDQRLTVTLAAQAAIAINNAQLFNDLQRSNTDLTAAYDATIEGWSRAMDLRDKETEGHTLRVTEMTLELVREMNISESQLTHIRRGALLHDIGKLGVPDNILLNPDKLTDKEWKIMREHPAYAHEMLSSVTYLQSALDIPYCHHEKWDGTGYPRGLKAEEIPLVARIFAIVDVWDAVTSDRPYRPAWTRAKALKFIRAESGKHFDPQVVDAFLKMIADK